MNIELADFRHQEALRSFASECFLDGIAKYENALEDQYKYLDYLVSRSRASKPLPNGLLPCTTFFCLDGDEIVGAIRLRHGTNKDVEGKIGHIGYETRPSARGRGVAKYMLSWVIENAADSDVIVICDQSNEASRKVIESAGGLYTELIATKDPENRLIKYYCSV